MIKRGNVKEGVRKRNSDAMREVDKGFVCSTDTPAFPRNDRACSIPGHEREPLPKWLQLLL